MATKRRPRRTAPRSRTRRSQRNPTDSKLLATARRLSKRFHGTPAAVVELAPSERQGRSRFATVVGQVASIAYEPPARSKRGGDCWEHEVGDRGRGKPVARHRPLLAIDPRSKRPFLIFGRSPLRFSSARGLVG